jgi:hypothetical protein
VTAPSSEQVDGQRTAPTTTAALAAQELVIRVAGPDQASGAGSRESSDPERDGTGRLLEGGTSFLKAIAGPVSLATVVLYYFGWVRSNAIASYWGYSTDLIGLGNEDFLLRSVEALYRPLAVGVLMLLAAHHVLRWARTAIEERRGDDRRLQRASSVLLVLGGLMVAVGAGRLGGIENELQHHVWYITGTLLIAGPIVMAAGLWVRAACAWRARSASDATWPTRLLTLSTVAILVAVGLVGVFTLTTQFASRVGTGRAIRTEQVLADLAAVTLYSQDRLYLNTVSVGETELPDDDGMYRWRYDNLRLLTSGNGHAILLPGGYDDNNATAFVLPVGDGVRIDLDRTAARQRALDRGRPNGD